MRIGATFSATHARWLGLDPAEALAQVIELGLDPLRLCGYWDQPPADLDWQLDQAAHAGRRVVLTVGMKAPRWPEFHLPPGEALDLHSGGEVHADLPLTVAALTHVEAMVERFRDRSVIEWWQVENEPSNKSGPHRWWISPAVVAREVAAVRARDHRPIVLTTFGHFSRLVDEFSGHAFWNPAAVLGHGSGVEPELLELMQAGDVLGLDVYRSIGRRGSWVAHAGSPVSYLRYWQAKAGARGIECWVTELQAEPWEATAATEWEPRSVGPTDVADRLAEVRTAGTGTVLLWGVEYWLAQAKRGNPAWLSAGRAALKA
ncbi:MAG: hypothetical protein J2P43_09200 [Candidatus Dormibacteraeota bacterium]|nr:hypothetical protein [Candidatus Dormibacteraeota bacterium]MBO0745181.1 hypothetical protein [Candidatus Dormibacteraeota bacterium]